MFRLDHPSLLHSRFCVVTQRCSPRDDPKNGCVAGHGCNFCRSACVAQNRQWGGWRCIPGNLDDVACHQGTKICDFLYPIFRFNANAWTDNRVHSVFAVPLDPRWGIGLVAACALQQIMSVTERPFPLSPQSPFPFLFQVPHPFLRLQAQERAGAQEGDTRVSLSRARSFLRPLLPTTSQKGR